MTKYLIPILVLWCGAVSAQEFEVASVKPNTSGAPMVRIMGAPGSPRFSATNISLRMLVMFAYDVKRNEISGGASALDSDRYDLEAKAGDPKPTQEQIRKMVQSLLAERFQLKVHRETREVPVYALLPAKGGLKLVEPKEGGCVEFGPGKPPPPPPAPGQRPPTPCGGMMMGPNMLMGGKISMNRLADGLSNLLGRPVIDKTGYTGAFDVGLEFSPEGLDIAGMPGGGPPPPSDDSKPSIFTALQEQLGLRLESQKGPAELLVIDHAEKASEN